MNTYDLIVVGGGPAGLSCSLYSSRLGLATLVLETNVMGGLAAIAASIEDYPGIEKIDGWTFTRIMEKQAMRASAKLVESEQVIQISSAADGLKNVASASGRTYSSTAVVIATGGEPKKLAVEGEERLARKGVHYCAQCAGPAYKGGLAAVCGNGNPALIAALHLLQLAEEVFFITEDKCLSGEWVLQKKLKNENRFHLLPETRIRRIIGDARVEAVEVQPLDGGKARRLTIEGLFIYTGIVPRTGIVQADKDRHGFLKVDSTLQTSIAGIFAAGNVIGPDCRTVIAAGEGARAALSAAAYIDGFKARGRRP